MNINQLVSEINNSNLSMEDLDILNQLIVRKHKALHTAEALNNATKLKVGDVIRVHHEKLEGLTGRITKIKRTKCDITITSTGLSYTVPMSIVHPL